MLQIQQEYFKGHSNHILCKCTKKFMENAIPVFQAFLDYRYPLHWKCTGALKEEGQLIT